MKSQEAGKQKVALATAAAAHPRRAAGASC